jgi:hypothetical protein
VSVFGKIGNRLIQPDPTTAPPLNPFEHLIQGGPLGQSFQLSDQILLQRLPLILGAPLQLGVCLLREISHEYVGHACIMLSSDPEDKSPDDGGDASRQTSSVRCPVESLGFD